VYDWWSVAMATFLVGLFGFILSAMFGFTVLRVIARVTRTPGLTRDRIRYVVWPAVVAIIAMSVTFVVGVSSMHRYQHTDQQDLTLERQLAVPPLTGLHCPQGVAVDAAGNLYVADVGANQVLKLVAGSNTPTALPFTGLNLPNLPDNNSCLGASGVAVDAAGDVYVIDLGNKRVLKLAAGSSSQTVLPFTDLQPGGLAVQPAGNVYVADVRANQVLKLAAGSSSPTALPSIGGGGVGLGGGVAVDAAGTVYADVGESCGPKCNRSYLMRLAAGSGTWTKLPPPGGWVAVDAAGNVYVVHFDGGGLMKLAPGSSSWTRLPPVTSFRMAGGVAVDAGGNVYVTDNLSGEVDLAVAKNQGVVVKVPAT
jgi:sugar lactone lactonase YvrE